MNFSIERATPADFTEILELQNQNYIANLAADERADGFVSTPFTTEILETLEHPNRFLVARHHGGAFAGYVFMGSWSFCARWPAFQVAIKRFPLRWKNRLITVESTFQYGPVCVAREFRGQGVLPLLFEGVKREMQNEFAIGTTWINAANTRSMHAHTQKLGLAPLDKFSYNGSHFVLLGFETTPHNSL